MNMYSDDPEEGSLDKGSASINTYLADTISSVFENVAVVDVRNSTNKELFASSDSGYFDRLEKNVQLEEDTDLRAMMERVLDTRIEYVSRGNVMTDDKAPVELLGMRQIDLIIKDEVSYYKEIYKERGLSGLLEILF